MFFRPDKFKPSPVMGRKQIERQESVSPRPIRRGTFIISPNTNLLGKPGSMWVPLLTINFLKS